MKYTEECLYNKKYQLKKTTKNITLLNSRGTNTHSCLPENYSEYLLIVEMKGAALVSKEVLQKYVSVNGDSLTVKIPANELHIIFQPNEITQLTEKNELHIKHLINYINASSYNKNLTHFSIILTLTALPICLYICFSSNLKESLNDCNLNNSKGVNFLFFGP